MQSTRKGKTAPEHAISEMGLGRCLVDGDPEATSRARRTTRKTFGVSLAVEILLLVLLVAMPLLTSVAQPQLHQIPPPQLAFFRDWRAHSPVQHVVPPMTAHIPQIPNPFPQAAPPVTLVDAFSGEEPGVPTLGSPGGDVPGGVQITEILRTPPVEPPRVVQPAQQEKHPVKISEGVLEAQLISRIEPQYPSLALQTRTQGTVRLHAIISRDGRITSLDVISGHPFLVKAALDAVRQWRYRPTTLNGEPVEVETFITVIFRLHG
jgi:TonB family protein